MNRENSIEQSEILFYYGEGADEETLRLAEEKTGLRAEKLPEPDAERRGEEEQPLILLADGEGLALKKGGSILRGDFGKMLPRLIPNNLGHEMLVRAARFKNRTDEREMTAVDATAGLGEDAFLLAGAGFRVTMFERDPLIALLLYDALERGKKDERLSPVLDRMELRMENSVEKMPILPFAPDIVLLDPMFPKRQKSGMIKKKFQLLQRLEQPCSDEEELLNAALACRPRRIVIKRPAKGPYLAGRKPGYSITGGAIRYDCIVVSGQ